MRILCNEMINDRMTGLKFRPSGASGHFVGKILHCQLNYTAAGLGSQFSQSNVEFGGLRRVRWVQVGVCVCVSHSS